MGVDDEKDAAHIEAATANPEGWVGSQRYELRFWRESWPYRDWPLDKLQELRHGDGCWFLNQMEFQQTDPRAFENFKGTVLEVGCGPIGFFERMDAVEVTAQDSLMRAYAENLSFSTLGKRGATTYNDLDVSEIDKAFDFVVCSNVLDHTADWLCFLCDCRNRIRPGGQLLLYTDSRGVPAEGHTQVFSPSQVIRLVELLGATSLIVARSTPSTDGHCDFKNAIRACF